MTPNIAEIEVLRPAGPECPAGSKPFLAEGPLWGYHFARGGLWIQGRRCRHCGASAAPSKKCGCEAPDMVGEHGGEDVLAPPGAKHQVPLVAPANCTILRSGFEDKYGNSILAVLDANYRMSDGKKSRPLITLAHCSTLFFDKGRCLRRGEVFGLMGSTGNTGDPPVTHCHVQVEEDGPWPRKPMRIKWALA